LKDDNKKAYQDTKDIHPIAFYSGLIEKIRVVSSLPCREDEIQQQRTMSSILKQISCQVQDYRDKKGFEYSEQKDYLRFHRVGIIRFGLPIERARKVKNGVGR
jgi:hypothetical protein